jgi:hypothetical protein
MVEWDLQARIGAAHALLLRDRDYRAAQLPGGVPINGTWRPGQTETRCDRDNPDLGYPSDRTDDIMLRFGKGSEPTILGPLTTWSV